MDLGLAGDEHMEQLSPQDAQFLYMESEHNLTHVTSISIYDPTTVPGGKTVRFKDIMRHVEERLHMSPLFKRRLVRVPLELDYPYWVEDEYFDLEYHMRHGRLPEPGDWRQFCIHLARYHSRPLDMKRPPWEMFVIEGLDYIENLPKGSYAIATKIHHSAVDGASLTQFFGALGDLDNARAAYERALKIDETAFGQDHPNVALRLSNLGGVLNAQGDLNGARAAFDRALQIVENAQEYDHSRLEIT